MTYNNTLKNAVYGYKIINNDLKDSYMDETYPPFLASDLSLTIKLARQQNLDSVKQ